MNKITLLFLLVFQVSISQNYTEYATGSSTNFVVNPEQGICLMGGATEHDEAMRWFLRKANGGDVVVLRASGSDGYNDYFYSELGITINSVTTFVINNENGALDPYVLNKVAEAEAIWFAGGDQYNYVSFFKDNAMEDALNHFINVKQGVIGGTSAGMAILGSSYFSAENGTVTSSQAMTNPYHNRVTLGYDDFLEIPFLENVITDSHYDDPDRRGRHTAFLARYITDNNTRAFGIACNEYTAVCVDSNGKASVFGDYPNYDEFAYFLQTKCVDDYIPEVCEPNSELIWVLDGLAVYVCKVPGTQDGNNYFDISNWNTESGGIWERWYIPSGSLVTDDFSNPNCNSLSVEDNQKINLSIFPNPFINEITILSELEIVDIEMFNIQGKQMNVTLKNSEIDVSGFQSGMYFLKLKTSKTEQVFKLLKK